MSTAGASSQTISLPQGGGAIKGIGEKFAPDLHTGTGNFSIPLALLPGRNGFQPQLNLLYSTGNGNGPFGLGWTLGIPQISRQTDKGVPRYNNEADTFVLSGAEDLVLIEAAAEVMRYRPRVEGLFAQIERHISGDHDYWIVRSKDGLVSVYGAPDVIEGEPAVLANPVERRHIFAWYLSRTIDSFGNHIEYIYERDTDQETPAQREQLYLKEIRYGNYTEPTGTRFLVSVNFNYDQQRPDAYSEYRAGFEIHTRRRCVSITVTSHADQPRLYRTYELGYLDQVAERADELPVNGVSLLNQIQITGHDGAQTEQFPPIRFGYTRFTPQQRKFMQVSGSDLPAHPLNNAHVDFVDLFGCGLLDILEMNGTARYWRNLGCGQFDRPRPMTEVPLNVRLGDQGVQLLDADGDGRLDLMVSQNGLSGYFPTRFGATWDRRSFQRYRTAPTFSLEDPNVRLLDLDGDGVIDALRSGQRMECFFNDPHTGWDQTRHVERRSLDIFPNVSLADERVKLADMTGDGLQDIVLITDGNVEYWPNLGHGNWGRRVHMLHAPRLPYGFAPQRLLVGDVDGDGRADILYVDDSELTLWINRHGTAWSDPITIHGTPSGANAVRLIDLLGTGVGGVLWDVETGLRSQLYFLDFTGGTKPYLLDMVDNQTGAVTRVHYASSTQFYLHDAQRASTRWKTPLPFPVQVIARVESIDTLSHGRLTTEYRYHHGYWDGAEREFRGFGMVEQLDTEVFTSDIDAHTFSPPLLTRTWFHQGPVGDEFGDWYETDYSAEFWAGDPQKLDRPPDMEAALRTLKRRDRRDALRALRGVVLRTELYALDGTPLQDRPYTITEGLYGFREAFTPTDPDRLRIFFPHLLAQRTTQWERGTEPMTSLSFVADYDAYGQPRDTITIAVPRGQNYFTGGDKAYLATRTQIVFAQRDDAQFYMVDRAAQQSAYEIINDGRMGVFDFVAAVVNNSLEQRLIGQTTHYYDGKAFVGLQSGQLGDHGVLVRSETLALTDSMLLEVYGKEAQPPYLAETPNWTPEYPAAFCAQMSARAGYSYNSDSQQYFVTTQRLRYDFQEGDTGYGLIVAQLDALGNETTIAYDIYRFLPTEVTSPNGLTLRAVYDYRLFQPIEMHDTNGNRSASSFTPLGMIASLAVMGKPEENVGDTLEEPGVRFVYDLFAFAERGEPVSVRTIRRVHHADDSDVSVEEREETIQTIEYSDGFGRVLQTRTQAESVIFDEVGLPIDQDQSTSVAVGRRSDDIQQPSVVVSGWQTYDNKGRVIEKYEPFFSEGWAYAPQFDAPRGQKITLYYDPRGQAIHTVNPDGSEQRVIFGVPQQIDNPDVFNPTPWETYTYDVNDNAGRTHKGESDSYRDHWNTPASGEVDALGRAIASTVRNGMNPDTDWHTTRFVYDIRGNLLNVIDTLGRTAFTTVYDLLNRPLTATNIDAGTEQVVFNAAGNIVERRDSKGALTLQAYDTLNRPIAMWARDAIDQPITLRECLVYGEAAGLSSKESASHNLLGKLYQHYDEAGLLTAERYDFKGNLLDKTRHVFDDSVMLVGVKTGETFLTDWQPAEKQALSERATELLSPVEYRTSATFDGLNRAKSIQYPQDVEGERRTLRPRYNRAGALEYVELDGASFVNHIAYNARGQRTLVAYGNGVMTRYAYDPHTFRLARLHNDGYKVDDLTYHPANRALQDIAYEYDLAGNITTIHDRTPESGIPNTPLGLDALDRLFTYDPRYRLRSATGREHDQPPLDAPWEDTPRGTDVNQARGYTEQYHYDSEGNLLGLRHLTGTEPGSFTRQYTPALDGNRLLTMAVGKTDSDYTYDANGNLIRENTERHFTWDHADRLCSYRTQAGDSEPSVFAQYLYDVAGQRVKKLVRKQGGLLEATVYIDGLFEHHWQVQADTVQENNTLHVMDNASRIALVRIGRAFPDDSTPAIKFHLGDHLGSSSLTLDENGGLINREEYTPYGETSFGSFARKRYRFTGKERDEESSLYYHGARYYAPWLARWASPDPAGMVDGTNLYAYVRGNPLSYADPSGRQSKGKSSGNSKPGSSEDNPIIIDQIPPGLPEDVQKMVASGKPFGIVKEGSQLSGEEVKRDNVPAGTIWLQFVSSGDGDGSSEGSNGSSGSGSGSPTVVDYANDVLGVVNLDFIGGAPTKGGPDGLPGATGDKPASIWARIGYFIVSVVPVERMLKATGGFFKKGWNKLFGKAEAKALPSLPASTAAGPYAGLSDSELSARRADAARAAMRAGSSIYSHVWDERFGGTQNLLEALRAGTVTANDMPGWSKSLLSDYAEALELQLEQFTRGIIGNVSGLARGIDKAEALRRLEIMQLALPIVPE